MLLGKGNDQKSGIGTASIQRRLLPTSPVAGLPEWETRLYLIEYPPGAEGGAHYHPVVGVGYVLSGTIVSAFGARTRRSLRCRSEEVCLRSSYDVLFH
jgi:quercetin dioxygenase-like cupin family protein